MHTVGTLTFNFRIPLDNNIVIQNDIDLWVTIQEIFDLYGTLNFKTTYTSLQGKSINRLSRFQNKEIYNYSILQRINLT